MFEDDPFRHLWLELLVLGVAFAGAIFRWMSRRSVKQRSQSWPAVQGHVESVSVETDSGRGSLARPQMLDIAYSYMVAGTRYAAFDELSFRRLDDAERVAKTLKDTDVTVRHNPRSPRESTIDYPSGLNR